MPVKTKKPVKVKVQRVPAAEMRVLIAKDVLRNLKNKKYLARQGIFLATEIPLNWDGQNGIPLHTLLKKRIKPCRVCAIGAVFVAKVERLNAFKYTPTPFEARRDSIQIDSIHRSDMVKAVKGIFPAKMLESMENVFEGSSSYPEYEGLNPAEVMTKMMKEIVKNKGNFIVKEDDN